MFGELFVDDMPLLGEERVCDAETGTNGSGRVIRTDGGRGTFCPLAWVLVLEQLDSGKEAVGRFIAGLDGRMCTEGVVAGKDGMAMWRGVFGGTKEPRIWELADLTDKLEAKAEFGDALVYGWIGGGGMVVKKEVVERYMITLGRDV